MNFLVVHFHGTVHVSRGHFLCKKGVGGVCGVLCCVGMGILQWAGIFPGGWWWKWGVRLQQACAQIKIGAETPGGGRGCGFLAGFEIGGATTLPKGRIGPATPKNWQNRFLRVATCTVPAEWVATTPKVGPQPLGVATPKLGGREPSPLK